MYKIFLCLFITLNISVRAEKTLSLDEAIEIATTNSLQAKMARFAFLSKYWTYRTYKAEWLPSLNVSGRLFNYNRSVVEVRSATDGRLSYVENNTLYNRLTLSLDQNLPWKNGKVMLQTSLSRLDQFNYGNKTYNSEPLIFHYDQPLRGHSDLQWRKKIDPLEYENAKKVYIESCQDIAISTARLFFDVLQAEQNYSQNRQNALDLEELLKISEKRFQLGTVTKSDVLQLELSMLNARMAINNARQDVESKRIRLFSFLNLGDHQPLVLRRPQDIPLLVIPVDDVVERVYQNSSYSTNQKLALLKSEQALSQAKASSGIQIKLDARVGFNQTANSLNQAYKHVKDNQVVGVTINMPLFDWGLGRGRVKMARAELQLMKAKLEQEDADYRQTIRTHVFQFNNQSDQCHTSRRASEVAEERYEIAKKRFENGTISVTELNTALQELEKARYQYLSQIKLFWESYYNLQKLTLYDYLNQHDVVVDFNKIIKQ